MIELLIIAGLVAFVVAGARTKILTRSQEPQNQPAKTLSIKKHGIEVTAYDYLCYGIGSVKLKGKELIDNISGISDHGRQLQTAVQYQTADGANTEQYNPTECGRGGFLLPTMSASEPLGSGVTEDGRLQTSCRAAFWFPYKDRIVSNTVIRKSVKIEPWGLDYRVEIDPQKEDEVVPTHFNAEILTGYMPWEFQDGGFVTKDGVVAAVGEKQIDVDNNPCFMSTPDGKCAMGVFYPDTSHYAVMRFDKDKVVKWSCVVSDKTPNDIYKFSIKVFIGDRDEVIAALRDQVINNK